MKPQLLLPRLAFIILLMSLSHSGLAQCVAPFEQGSWSNIDPATRGITKIEVSFSCNDQVLCGVDANGNENESSENDTTDHLVLVDDRMPEAATGQPNADDVGLRSRR